MHRFFIVFLFFAAGFVFVQPVFAAIPDWQQGVTLRLRSQPIPDIEAELRKLASLGVNFLTITPGWVTDSIVSSNVERKATTPPDDVLIHTITYAHSLGMKMMLKPHLDLKDNSRWRANIDPLNKATFFANYNSMMLHYADIAAAHGVEQMAIGAELFKLSSNKLNEPYWRDLISKIRTRYRGALTYSAIFGSGRDELNSIPFWDALDSVGLSAYLPLATTTNPTVDSLKANWSKIERDHILPALEKFKKPILIAEVGFKSQDGAAMKPEGSSSAALDLQEQKDLYQAFFEFWGSRSYLAGVHFWDWWPDPNAGGATDKDYSPQRKPAEDVLRQYFSTNATAEEVLRGLDQPVVLATLSDRRLFVGEKASGKVKIVKDGVLLTEPLLDINDFVSSTTYFDDFSERGLLGIAFHPRFLTDVSRNFVYVYYTLCVSPNPDGTPGTSNGCNPNASQNRVARFRVIGDKVDTSFPLEVIIDGIPSPLGYHNAGWIGFGQDEKLYVAVGDGGGIDNRTRSQKVDSLNGKILRANDDGSVPDDNPTLDEMSFVDPSLNPSGTLKHAFVWAMGLRNPWRCRFSPQGRLYCGDVGEKTQEEVSMILRGGNYGWPHAEGDVCPSPVSTSTSCPSGLITPLLTYGRSTGASIVGGDFAVDRYFFADYVEGWIQEVQLDSLGLIVPTSVKNVLYGAGSIVDLIFHSDGFFYFLDIAQGTLNRIRFNDDVLPINRPPQVHVGAHRTFGTPPFVVQFSSNGTFDPDSDPIRFDWSFGDGATSSEPHPVHTFSTSGLYQVMLVVTENTTSSLSGSASLLVRVGLPPVVTIIQPAAASSLFRVGQLVVLAGSAFDPESGFLPTSSLHFKVMQHHNDHTHPYIGDLVGSPQSFVPELGHDPGIWYEVVLSATDSTGLISTTSVSLFRDTAIVLPLFEGQIKIDSPANNSKISGEKKMKILIPNVKPSRYTATYNVDGRGEVLMENSGDFKQVKVNFDAWKWHGSGPYRVVFTARDMNGTVVDTKSLTLYVKR